MSLALPTVAIVVVAAWRARPAPARVRALGPGESGSTVAHAALTATMAVAAAWLAGPWLAAAAGLAVVAARRHRARRAAAGPELAVERQLPEVIDLFGMAARAGLTVHMAVDVVARRAGGALGPHFAAVRRAASTRRLADVLDELPAHAGEAIRPLATALAASERYGAPLSDVLDRLAGAARQARRRRAEERARRLPVLLLFPLVLCVLPAFALLTVAPLLAGSLRGLRP